jgi:hypothetical protein
MKKKYERYSIRLKSRRGLNMIGEKYLIQEWGLYDAQEDKIIAVCYYEKNARHLLQLIKRGIKAYIRETLNII